ncbi:MAG: sigma 54-interacting transcriptional regulator [Planctomycetota bacterium]
MLEKVLESMPVGIIVTDAEGRIRLFNRAAEDMTGFGRDDVLSRTAEDLHEEICLEALPVTPGEAGSEGRARCRIRTREGEDRQFLRTSIPFPGEPGGSIETLTDVTDVVALREQMDNLRGILGDRDRFHGMVGRSAAMLAAFERIRLAADSNATVLLQGESGTGKELAAAAIHFSGARADAPFVKVNCSALPETLLESELFGHAKGAFTGAVSKKVGRFERADGGTLLIDEVGDMSPVVQLKLLRVLETREFERLGETESIRVDVRIVSASHRDLKALVQEGKFREDLYYRVNVFPIEVPALRDRREDLPLLVDHFVAKFREETGRPVREVSPEAMRRLMAHSWPGNVRELANAIEHAFVTARGKAILPDDLPAGLRSAPERDVPPGDEREMVLEALRAEKGHRERAAARLGVSRVTLWKRMKRHDVTWP